MKRIALIFVSLISCWSAQAAEETGNEVRVSRYTVMQAVAAPEQIDLMAVVVRIEFPSHINTVGEALSHLLERSGYRLASLEASDPALPLLLKNPLPMVHRVLGPVTLRNALNMLAGSVWNLVIDPVNRIVSFELLDEYKNFRPVVSN